jgi:hypothetical protein
MARRNGMLMESFPRTVLQQENLRRTEDKSTLHETGDNLFGFKGAFSLCEYFGGGEPTLQQIEEAWPQFLRTAVFV